MTFLRCRTDYGVDSRDVARGLVVPVNVEMIISLHPVAANGVIVPGVTEVIALDGHGTLYAIGNPEDVAASLEG
jgi:hypothetical protein